MPWKLEARLVLSDGNIDGAIPIARSSAAEAVRTLGAQVVAEAAGEAAALRRVDPLLGRLAGAEAQKLRRVIAALEAGGDPAALRLVRSRGGA